MATLWTSWKRNCHARVDKEHRPVLGSMRSLSALLRVQKVAACAIASLREGSVLEAPFAAESGAEVAAAAFASSALLLFACGVGWCAVCCEASTVGSVRCVFLCALWLAMATAVAATRFSSCGSSSEHSNARIAANAGSAYDSYGFAACILGSVCEGKKSKPVPTKNVGWLVGGLVRLVLLSVVISFLAFFVDVFLWFCGADTTSDSVRSCPKQESVTAVQTKEEEEQEEQEDSRRGRL